MIIPYIFWSFISFLANVAGRYVERKLTFEYVIDEFYAIFISARSVWFLIVLFISEMICIMCFYISKKLNCSEYTVLLISWITISLMPVNSFLCIYKFKWLFPFLVIGMICREYKLCDKINKTAILFGALFIIGRIFLYDENFFNSYINFSYFNVQSIVVGALYYILSIFSILFILFISMSMKETFLGRKIALAGQYSLEIYVIHMLWVKFIVFAPNIVLANNTYIYIFFAAYSLTITIVIVLLCKYTFEKFKLFCVAVGKL